MRLPVDTSVTHVVPAGPTRRATPERRPLLGVQDVATWLGVNVVFVRRLVSERRIPFLKIGKYVRFDPDEVHFWMNRMRVHPPARTSGRRSRRSA